MPVVPLELPSYQRKENWGAAETFYQLVRKLAGPSAPPPGTTRERAAGRPARCNILGPTALGFRHRDDVREMRDLLSAPGHRGQRGRAAGRHARPTSRAWARPTSTSCSTPRWRCRRRTGCSATSASRSPRPCRSASAPRGTSSREVAALAGVDPQPALDDPRSRSALVRALGRLDLPDRQARLRLRRRHPRGRRGARRQPGARLHGGRPRHLQPRVRPRGARRRQALRRRGADHRRLPRGRGRGRRAAARAGARHADGAPHRQAPGHPLRA